MVYAPLPAALVEWLREMCQVKPLLNCIWLSAARSTPKPKATANISLIYRAVIEQFIEAPGIRGMVMLVFTLPGFNRVFESHRRQVHAAERDVCRSRSCLLSTGKEHDGVGQWRTGQD
ncbi:isocitrate dehydrogenase kinase/phosphatase-domain containing protein [Shigella flexneri]